MPTALSTVEKARGFVGSNGRNVLIDAVGSCLVQRIMCE